MGLFDVVVVGADDSPTARRAIDAASQLAHMSNGTLHIVTAVETKPRHEGSLPAEFKDMNPDGEAEALLQVLSFIAKKNGVDPVLHHVVGDPADAIITTAEQVKADLIVVGNRGMKGARRVLGSVPNSVAHGANCSVAIIDTTSES
jgi:nucleotide-binding universal stress UspA family protein